MGSLWGTYDEAANAASLARSLRIDWAARPASVLWAWAWTPNATGTRAFGVGSHAFLAALALSLMGCNRQQGSPRRGGVVDTDPVDLYRGWGSVWAEQQRRKARCTQRRIVRGFWGGQSLHPL